MSKTCLTGKWVKRLRRQSEFCKIRSEVANTEKNIGRMSRELAIEMWIRVKDLNLLEIFRPILTRKVYQVWTWLCKRGAHCTNLKKVVKWIYKMIWKSKMEMCSAYKKWIVFRLPWVILKAKWLRKNRSNLLLELVWNLNWTQRDPQFSNWKSEWLEWSQKLTKSQ